MDVFHFQMEAMKGLHDLQIYEACVVRFYHVYSSKDLRVKLPSCSLGDGCSAESADLQ